MFILESAFYWCLEHNILWTFAHPFLLTPYTLMGIYLMNHLWLELDISTMCNPVVLQHLYIIWWSLFIFFLCYTWNNVRAPVIVISTQHLNHLCSLCEAFSIDYGIVLLYGTLFSSLSTYAISCYSLISAVCCFVICAWEKHICAT